MLPSSLNQLHASSNTTVPSDDWPPAVRPEIPPPLNIHAVQAQMTAELLVGWAGSPDRNVPRQWSEVAAAAKVYCVEETERTSLIYQSLVLGRGLVDAPAANEETTVIEAPEHGVRRQSGRRMRRRVDVWRRCRS